MPDTIAERTTGLFEAHKGSNPRILFFHLVLGVILLVLVGGLAYQQLGREDLYHEREKVQNQRRILVPGPRGHIYDREGNLLVGNRPRFSTVIYLDEIRGEIYREFLTIRRAYRESGDKDLPNELQLSQIARYTVVHRYLEEVNRAIGREFPLDSTALTRHHQTQRLLPYTLIDDLAPEDYARLLEQLPVQSPLQVQTSSSRIYPYGKAAAHTIGSVKVDDVEVPENFPGAELRTLKMKGTVGRDGLEAQFDPELQGEAGGTIYRVDPSGYRIEPPLEKHLPVQGRNLTASLDIELQIAAETKLEENEMSGAAVAIDIQTGEILVLASNPAYDLNEASPRISTTKYREIEEAGGWLNRATQGLYPPGSAFKVLTALAGIRSGAITADTVVECNGFYRVGNRLFRCDNHADRGELNLVQAIAKSCNTFFYKTGLETTADNIAAEARRFGFGQRTGIEIPHETTRSLVPDPEWKRRERGLGWNPGDTANYAIGQGDLLVTPLQMATFMASVARGQIETIPTLLHAPGRATQRTTGIGIDAMLYEALMEGMAETALTGTARILQNPRLLAPLPGLTIGGKTGTAQIPGSLNVGWFICFAPVDDPRIAIAVAVEGNIAGETTGGGTYAVPVAHGILKAWWDKQQEGAR